MNSKLLSLPAIWKDLLLGGTASSDLWVEGRDLRSVPICLATIGLGVGLYGASIGIWQGPRQAAFVAVKLPLVIVLTLGINGLLNGILALLLGVRLGFVQTAIALLSAFSVFALIVGSLSPITLGMALDAPGPESAQAGPTHRQLILVHTSIIAFAGLVSTCRLHRLLRRFSSSPGAAKNGLIALITGNLFAGAQVGFLLRPIFGQPGLVIEFLRPDLFEGNFYESVWWALRHAF